MVAVVRGTLGMIAFALRNTGECALYFWMENMAAS